MINTSFVNFKTTNPIVSHCPHKKMLSLVLYLSLTKTTNLFYTRQAKLRKMVDEQVSVGSRVEIEEPEPADPLITPASSALDRPEQDPRPAPPERRLLIGTLEKPRSSLNGDREATLNRSTRLSIRNGKDNPFIGTLRFVFIDCRERRSGQKHLESIDLVNLLFRYLYSILFLLC